MKLGIGSLASGIQRSMRIDSDLKMRKGVEGEGGMWVFISTTGGDEGSKERSMTFGENWRERRVNFWDVLGVDSSVLRFELGFIGESGLGDPTTHVKLDAGAELTLNKALVTSSNGANSGGNMGGFEIFIGK